MYDADDRFALAGVLARALPGGAWTAEALAERGAGVLDRWPRWMTALAMEVVAVHRSPPSGRSDVLVSLIASYLEGLREDGEPMPEAIEWIAAPERPPPSVPPRPRLRHDWPIARIGSVAALAETLELSPGQLAWLADVRGLERTVTAERLRNYRYRALPRAGGLPRVIEAPKARLKEIQRWVLREILDRVPVHAAAHGFCRGRSVITHAGAHSGSAVVLALDLRDFFASVTAGRVYGALLTVGYAPPVAHVLTGLCTNVVPQTVWEVVARVTAAPAIATGARFRLGRRLATPHLPQGAPTSPALANLAAFGLDRRLSGLARSLDLTYTRYADDLTFSGSVALLRSRSRIEDRIAGIAREEGFAINRDKTSLRTHGSRQAVCGIVVNERPNVPRDDYDRLRALLHNAARDGAAAHNRVGAADFEAHVRGRIAWVSALHPGRGEKLSRMFERVDWRA
jgi:RNA-directed DNA polymerase